MISSTTLPQPPEDPIIDTREVDDHSPADYVFPSGTKVREVLAKGIARPPEFFRSEVAEILMARFQAEAAETDDQKVTIAS